VAGAPVTSDQGLCSTAATSIRVRQRTGVIGLLLRRVWRTSAERNWKLPNGTTAEQWGERRINLLLVRSEEEGACLDESRVKAAWPVSETLLRIGPKLFVVAGVAPPGGGEEDTAASPQGCPRAQTEQLLAAARTKGDRRAEASALVDLGIIHMREDDPKRALERMEDALAIARDLGELSLERDVLTHLGLAARNTGQPQRALAVLEDCFALAWLAYPSRPSAFGQVALFEGLQAPGNTFDEPDAIAGRPCLLAEEFGVLGLQFLGAHAPQRGDFLPNVQPHSVLSFGSQDR